MAAEEAAVVAETQPAGSVKPYTLLNRKLWTLYGSAGKIRSVVADALYRIHYTLDLSDPVILDTSAVRPQQSALYLIPF